MTGPLTKKGGSAADQALGRTLRIGDLAKASGKSARALRLYEEMGLLTPGTRTAGGFRLYGEDAVGRVRWISYQQALGFTLSDIDELIGAAHCPAAPRDAMAEVRRRYQLKFDELNTQISHLTELRDELRASLDYLEGCHACGETQQGLRACRTCAEQDMRAPELVAGVTTSAAQGGSR